MRSNGVVPPRADKLLSTNQVAKRLVVSDRTVRYWCDIGEIRALKIGPGNKLWRIWESDLEAYLAAKEADATTPTLPRLNRDNQAVHPPQDGRHSPIPTTTTPSRPELSPATNASVSALAFRPRPAEPGRTAIPRQHHSEEPPRPHAEGTAIRNPDSHVRPPRKGSAS